jgi:phenylacetate-coenzyme A ligase PaaK-like adenylate-forming protein
MRLIPESLGPKRLIDIRGDFGSICDELTAFRPTLLSSFPYMLRMLAEAALAGRLRIAPTRITSSGDVLSASDRQAVAAAFGVAPHDYYCATEATYIAWECDQHDGLHVNADYLIVESVDAGNRPVPPGRLGERLLLTNLSNRALPLVRYEMSDQVEYADGPCPCGCLLPRIRTVAGRVEHVLRLPGAAGGRVALVPEHIDDFVGPLEGLANYQVIQQAPSRLRVNVVPATGADADAVAAAVRRGLAACFARYGVAEGVAVELCRVERLAPIRPGATKVCHYWNLCPEA